MTTLAEDFAAFAEACRAEALPVATLEWRLFDDLADASRAKPYRTLREFAEQEIVLPNGPHEGKRFSCDRQPFAGVVFDELQSGRWRRYNFTGPQQSGKTLVALVIPLLYYVFELRQTVILGGPDEDTLADKWAEDILPVIEASAYAELLPKRGPGSRGGSPLPKVTFGNGVSIRFMSGRGSDKSRAGFTARFSLITETDGMDTPGPASRESDPVTQIQGRTDAYDERAVNLQECTVSTEDGRTWTEHQAGTESRIATQCPECAEWVTPERDDLVGHIPSDLGLAFHVVLPACLRSCERRSRRCHRC